MIWDWFKRIFTKKVVVTEDSPGHELIEGTKPWYRRSYDRCEFDAGYEQKVANDARLVLSHKERYEKAGKILGIPWFVIGGIHFKEASCNFAGCLHNGQRVIGKDAVRMGLKTTIVPVGRGPFATWEDSCVDAIRMHPIGRVTDWELGNMLYHVERYNGTGYLTGAGRAETSPYLWARTSINDDRGKYVRDGKFDPTASTQSTTGFCAILKWLERNAYIEIKRELSA